MDSGDEAGAINNRGVLTCNNCSFIGNKANLAGAIYSAHGAVADLSNCTFINNRHIKDKGADDLYNYNNAVYIIDGCKVDKSSKLNLTIYYKDAPSNLEKNLYGLAKLGTLALSFGIGLGGTLLLSPGLGVPLASTIAVISGTIVGTAADFALDVSYYSSMHCLESGNLFKKIPLSLLSHFQMALLGGQIGSNIYKTKYLKKLIDMGVDPESHNGIKDITIDEREYGPKFNDGYDLGNKQIIYEFNDGYEFIINSNGNGFWKYVQPHSGKWGLQIMIKEMGRTPYRTEFIV